MSKKKNLIDRLRGSIDELYQIENYVDGVTMYDENGYVDNEFLTEVLVSINRFMDVSNLVIRSVSGLIIHDSDSDKKNVNDTGATWTVEDILKHCTLEDNILKLPKVQFNKKSYTEAKKWVEEAGGRWQGGKVQGFTFPFNANRVFSILHDGKRCNLQQEYQYFATPPEVADWLVMLAGGIHEHEKVLEPSAGTGSIIDAIHRSCKDVVVDCFELMPENKELLSKKSNIQILGDDFTTYNLGSYDKIIANPPFCKNQDIRHVKRMYDHLNDGGTVAAIMSCHWQYAKERECIEFREWLKSVGAKHFIIDEGAFKKSGTIIQTSAVVITKSDNL